MRSFDLKLLENLRLICCDINMRPRNFDIQSFINDMQTVYKSSNRKIEACY